MHLDDVSHYRILMIHHQPITDFVSEIRREHGTSRPDEMMISLSLTQTLPEGIRLLQKSTKLNYRFIRADLTVVSLPYHTVSDCPP